MRDDFTPYLHRMGNFEPRSPDPDPNILKALDPDPPYMNVDPQIPGVNKVHTERREGTAARGCQVQYGNRIISTNAEWQMLPIEDCWYNIHRIQALCAFQFSNSGTTGNYVCFT
jgi:hypothetical protein